MYKNGPLQANFTQVMDCLVHIVSLVSGFQVE